MPFGGLTSFNLLLCKNKGQKNVVPFVVFAELFMPMKNSKIKNDASRSFLFSREVPIRLDYQGKRVDMTHGPLAGLLMGLGELNSSEVTLKCIRYRHG
jgi:hypothetical protein